MKRQLAIRLLQSILPAADETVTARLFRELEFLADYKYNEYEMYHPGRLFLESLCLWLEQFSVAERNDAMAFVRKELVFISRREFQQLAHVLYHDRIRQVQLDHVSKLTGIERHRVAQLAAHDEFDRTAKATLFVGMSDGARIDHLRRHNLEINNEQVITHYAVSPDRLEEVLSELRRRVKDPDARFRCLFLIDDFCGSGRTFARKTFLLNLGGDLGNLEVPSRLASQVKINREKKQLQLTIDWPPLAPLREALSTLFSNTPCAEALEAGLASQTPPPSVVKGSLAKLAENPRWSAALSDDASIAFCPLLISQYAHDRLSERIGLVSAPFNRTAIHGAAVLRADAQIRSVEQGIGRLCRAHYNELLEDEHTGNVVLGYDGCGFPLVLHHNTPNNSIYLLWARRNQPDIKPLFVRYERHGREQR